MDRLLLLLLAGLAGVAGAALAALIGISFKLIVKHIGKAVLPKTVIEAIPTETWTPRQLFAVWVVLFIVFAWDLGRTLTPDKSFFLLVVTSALCAGVILPLVIGLISIISEWLRE